MEDLLASFESIKTSFTAWGTVFLILTAFELLNARESHSLRHRLYGLLYWAILIVIGFVTARIFGLFTRSVGVRPLVELAPPAWGMLASIGAALVGAAIHDFFFYWAHRAQHRWFWRWHAVHHSVTRLNAINSYHHPSEPVVSLILLQVPMAFLVSDVNPTTPIMTAVLWCHIVWIHSPTRATLGPLRALFVDNRFHRIHHSREEHHFDKNFGAFTTVWDRLFGTCHMPHKNEWPEVGVEGMREPAGLRDWFLIPPRADSWTNSGSTRPLRVLRRRF